MTRFEEFSKQVDKACKKASVFVAGDMNVDQLKLHGWTEQAIEWLRSQKDIKQKVAMSGQLLDKFSYNWRPQ